MKISSFVLLFCTSCRCTGIAAQTRTFVDDAGIVHTTDKANPTFIAHAKTSIALMHQFGYADGVGIKGQLLGSYGPYRPRGSQMDLDDPNAIPLWPSDPTSKEVQFLKDLPFNFSPDCYDNNQRCQTLNLDIIKEANPDVWVYINNGSWFTGAKMKLVVDEVMDGKPPIFVDTSSYGEGCIAYNSNRGIYTRDTDKCMARSLIDVIERTNELASFLGIEGTMKNKDEDKNRMCWAAKRLSKAAQGAQRDGLRVMAANVFIKPFMSGGVTLNPLDPLNDAYLRTYEELGVPMLHPGKYPGNPEIIPTNVWFPKCEQGQDMTGCNNEAFYPVDLWLMEGRRLPNGTTEELDLLLRVFPEKALLSEQYAHWPMNDGAISYRAVARTFHYMASKLNGVSRVYPPTTCSPVNVTSDSYLMRTTGGIEPAGYACFNKEVQQLSYLKCPAEYVNNKVLPLDDDSWLFYANGYNGLDGEGYGGGSSESSSFSFSMMISALGLFFVTILFVW